jgi:hypothetical protein
MSGMAATGAILFIVVAIAACAAAVLAILGTAQLAMSGPAAIERDGLARGERAPAWSLRAADGAGHRSPPARPLQLIIFADHSLKSFPSVVDGLRQLRDQDPAVEIVVLLRKRSEMAEPVLRLIGLEGIPVLAGSAALYADYNVRVGPFAIFVDSAGRVRASSLVNHGWQIAKLRQLADVPLLPAGGRSARPPRRRLSGA